MPDEWRWCSEGLFRVERGRRVWADPDAALRRIELEEAAGSRKGWAWRLTGKRGGDRES